MSVAKKSLSVTAVLAIAVMLLISAGIVGLYFSSVSHVMSKNSPDGRHTAKLYRYQKIDLNFNLFIDGESVYYSPDFAPVDVDFREQIAWDASGENVVLTIAGNRLFGYQVREKRPLTDEELLNVRFTPFYKLRYEGTLPNEISAD